MQDSIICNLKIAGILSVNGHTLDNIVICIWHIYEFIIYYSIMHDEHDEGYTFNLII